MPPLKARCFHCDVVLVGRQAQNEYIKLRESNYGNHMYISFLKGLTPH